MSDRDTPAAEPAPPPHPLAVELAGKLTPPARALVVGIGNGRSIAPFLRAGIGVFAIENDAARARAARVRFAAEALVDVHSCPYSGPYPGAAGFDGALATSAFLHGDSAGVGAALAAVAARLKPGATLLATFGSTRDPRFGRGVRIDDVTFADPAGEEAGVPHVYFDESRLRRILAPFDAIELHEGSASETAGRWAHSAEAARDLRHWFVRARRRHDQ